MIRSFYTYGLGIVLFIGILILLFSKSESLFATDIQSMEYSVQDSTYIKSRSVYSKKYPFIRYELNYPEWQDSLALTTFYKALSRADKRKVKVLHIGDSHVQADFFTGEIRDQMQYIFGHGGRGMVFPYAAAGTHATRDYRTWSFGVWRFARNIQSNPEFTLGISGATIYTEDVQAGFRFQFRDGFIEDKDLVLKLYCDKNERVFDAQIIYPSGDTIPIQCSIEDGLPYAKIVLPSPPKDFTIRLDRNSEKATYFQCYGLSIESISGKGLLYHSVGINGAGYTAILRQGLMPEQIREINPDLVVVDLGANDFYPKIIDQPVFEENLRNVVRVIRAVCPTVSILVTCSQDIYCRKRNVAECKRFAAIARNIAFEMNCGFYDYYRISGGQYAMNKWYQHQLAKPDRVHLTANGYAIKGELYVQAYLNGFLQWMRGSKDAFILDEIPEPAQSLPVSGDALPVNSTKYIVKSGDNLGSIAQRFGVTVTQLKKWNALNSDRISIGQKLVVNQSATASPIPKPAEAKPEVKSPADKSVVAKTVYTVRSGDSLWSIAQKHGTTVEKIRKLNALNSDALKPGMKIKLP